MDIDRIQHYFDTFTNESLTANANNRSLIRHFSAPYGAVALEQYLQQNAWEDDLAHRTKVYLIKDREGQIVLYYSLRCGLVFDNGSYDKLPADQKQYVDWMTESLKSDNSANLQTAFDSCAQEFNYDVAQQLFEIADGRAKRKIDHESSEHSQNTVNVAKSYAAIELQHFCRNANYQPECALDVAFGFGLFWEKIAKQIAKISSMIGCEYIYLFAADQSEHDKPRRLVAHYISSLQFSFSEDITMIKPDYDMNCVGLIQPISRLRENCKKAWSEYSDHI